MKIQIKEATTLTSAIYIHLWLLQAFHAEDTKFERKWNQGQIRFADVRVPWNLSYGISSTLGGIWGDHMELSWSQSSLKLYTAFLSAMRFTWFSSIQKHILQNVIGGSSPQGESC